jgi:hypothetical protein
MTNAARTQLRLLNAKRYTLPYFPIAFATVSPIAAGVSTT